MLDEVQRTLDGPADAEVPPSAQHIRALRKLTRRPLTLTGAVIVLTFAVLAVIGPVIAPHDPTAINYSAVLAPPSAAFPFGTDDAGRDVLSRVLAGVRISLTVALIAVAIATLCGGTLGIIAGYAGGWAGAVIMRLMDIMLSFPDILLAIVVITVLGPSLTTVMIAVGIATIPAYTRTVRAAVLTVREQEYVEAARALGASPLHIMVSHILRNVLSPIMVLVTLSLGLAILAASGLSFIGLGAQPPTPELGDMLNEAQNYLGQAWWMAVFPGGVIVLIVMGLNLFGEGLREVLDPTSR